MPRKPRQSRSIATVNSIVEAGFICVSRHGLAGTTTNHIAEVAGISTGSLYEYFGNKDEIYQAMSERFLADVTAFIQQATPTVARMEIAEAIRELARGFGELLRQDNGRYLHLLRYIQQADSRQYAEPMSKVLMDLIVQYLINHPKYTRLRNMQTMSYIVINAGMYNVIRHLSSDNPPMSFDELIDGLVDLVTCYIDQDIARSAKEPPG